MISLVSPSQDNGRKRTNGNVVVIVDSNQIAELQVTSSRSSFTGNTLHSTAITEEHECVVVDKLEARFVKDSRSVRLSNGKTNGIGETLTERASGDLNSGGVMCLGVAGGNAIDLLRAKSVADLGAVMMGVLTRKCFKSSMLRA
jgi:hypothetical protein